MLVLTMSQNVHTIKWHCIQSTSICLPFEVSDWSSSRTGKLVQSADIGSAWIGHCLDQWETNSSRLVSIMQFCHCHSTERRWWDFTNKGYLTAHDCCSGAKSSEGRLNTGLRYYRPENINALSVYSTTKAGHQIVQNIKMTSHNNGTNCHASCLVSSIMNMYCQRQDIS